MNGIFFAIVAIAFIVAAVRQWTFDPTTVPDAQSPMELLGAGMIGTAGDSVTLAIALLA